MAYGFTYTLPTITGSHTDFPVILKTADFPSAALNGANQFLNGGGNLRAYTSSAKTTQLPVEVVSLVTGASPDALVWVKIPTAATGNTIYLEADSVAVSQPAVTDTYGRNAVWSDYEAVYHLEEAVNVTAGGYASSTGSNDGSGFSMALTEVAGQLGTAQDMDGSLDHIQIPSTAIDALEAANAFTLNTWVNFDSVASDGALIGSFGGAGSRQFLFYMDADGAGPNYRLLVTDSGGGSTATSTDSGGASASTWQKVTATWDGTTARVYVGGSLNSSASGARTMASLSQDASIGTDRGADTSRAADAKFDEVRIRDSAVSSDWDATEAANESAATAWGSVGAWSDSSGGTIVSIGIASESSQAFSISALAPSVVALGLATETDATFSLSAVIPKVVSIGTATEADQAFAITPVITSGTVVFLGTATESSQVFGLNKINPRTYELGLAVETDQALTIRIAGQETPFLKLELSTGIDSKGVAVSGIINSTGPQLTTLMGDNVNLNVEFADDVELNTAMGC